MANHSTSMDQESVNTSNQSLINAAVESALRERDGGRLDNQPTAFAQLSANSYVAQPIESMDPHLQRLIAAYRSGYPKQASVSAGDDEVAVTARVSDVEQWEELSEVRIGATIDPGDAGSDAIVTARIPVDRISFVREQPFVSSLKAAKPLFPTLHATTDELNSRPGELPGDRSAVGDGRGVVVGIVDYGCDFAHRNFINANGSSRLISIWNQSGATGSASPFGYGREYTKSEIDAALQSSTPYQTLGYGPLPDTPFSKGSHGTHVMDIAAGNGRGSGVAGVAPEAELVFVDVSHADIPFSGPSVVGSSFGDSTRLLEAVKYIFEKAGDRPCVVNISLGTNGGPHDGSTLVEDGLDRLVGQSANRAITIAASNSFADGIHAAGQVAQDGSVDLIWQVAQGDSSHNEFELWYDGTDRLELEIIAPDGTSLGRLESPDQLALGDSTGRMALFASNRLADPNNADNMMGVFLERRFSGWDPTGNWRLRIHGKQVSNGAFHAWIERDNGNPSRFAPPHDNTHTIGSISCGHKTIVVGSYDAHKSARPISYFSSAGPTRDGRHKPELSAPGHAVLAAHSRTGDGVLRKSGTSMAAPAVAGLIALVYEEAAAHGLNLHIDQLRELLEQACRRNPPYGADWDDRYGHGRVSAERAVQGVIDLAGGGSGAKFAAAGRKRRAKKRAPGKKTGSGLRLASASKKATSRKKVGKKRRRA